MQPILARTSEWNGVKAIGQYGALLLALLLGLSAAQADSTTNFTGDFAAAFWTNSPPGLGSVYFTNSSTELVLTGPNQPSTVSSSIDPITYNGPLGGGLAVGGTVQFNWAYSAGDAVSSIADFAWAPPGGESPTQILLGSGPPGATASGTFTTPLLLAGTTFQFLLTTDETPIGKPSGTLIITDFQFHPDIPEPSTGALLASLLIGLGATRWRRSRRQASGQR
jgi:hypothetical protein